MASAISETLLRPLSELLESSIGLHFAEGRWSELERGSVAASLELGFDDPEACIRWLLSSPPSRRQIDVLASHLTVGETHFFREKEGFEFLEQQVLPELVRARIGGERRLRIWSAGCCTGEEPYSIAMVVQRAIPDIALWQVTILGTDINPRFLRKASEGIYEDWSFRGSPSWIRESYFSCAGDGKWEVLPHLRKMVHFSYLNLAEESYPSLSTGTVAMDVIFCRNVLMYFSARHARAVVRRLHASLTRGGWLIVSPVDSLHLSGSRFVAVSPSVAAYRKDAQFGSGILGSGLPQPSVPPAEIGPEARCRPDRPPVAPEALASGASEPPNRAGAEGPGILGPERTSYQVALALYQQGLYAESAARLEDLLSAGGEGHDGGCPDGEAVALLIRAYANQGKLAEALDWCERAIAVDKLNPGFHYLHATVLQEQGMVDQALRSLRRALFLDQGLVLAHLALGNLTRQQGNLEESARHFENALSLLRGYRQEDTVPGSEGITAGRLMEILRSMSLRRRCA